MVELETFSARVGRYPFLRMNIKERIFRSIYVRSYASTKCLQLDWGVP